MTVNVASRGGESGQFKRGEKKTTKRTKHLYENYLRLFVLIWMPIKPVWLTLILSVFLVCPRDPCRAKTKAANSEERWSVCTSPGTVPLSSLHFSESSTHGGICLHNYFKIKLLYQYLWLRLLSLPLLSQAQVMQMSWDVLPFSGM